MSKVPDFSAKIRHFKCIGSNAQGFDTFKNINLVIGRNNSGKSTLLDLVDLLTQSPPQFTGAVHHKGQSPEIILITQLTEPQIRGTFPSHVRGGDIPGESHWHYGKKYIGANIEWCLNCPKKYISIENPEEIKTPITSLPQAEGYLTKLTSNLTCPFSGKIFRRLSAERDIVIEPDNGQQLELRSNGVGATHAIQSFINRSNLSSALVEENLLSDLNGIFGADAKFTDIVCQLHSNNHWEIYLEEESKGRIPLSLSGSGLKTIILVLVHIHLLPVILNKSIQDFIFAFEELENNLHPSLQRRLLDYLRDVSKKNNCIFFLSTHSNVAIDQFSRDADAQIIHVTHDGETASARTVQTYIDNRGILDDLDVRASDLLQANGIIWVEGPSDRIYLNRWIELWSDGQLREGTHYQCVFYGGRLLSHLTAAEPSDAESAISMLSVNRNSIVLIDSDKRAATSRINETKQRIVSEINKQNGLAWVTKGREIENYLPIDVLTALLEVELPSKPDPYEDLFAFMDKHKNSAGTYYRGQKPLLAEKACQFMTKENLGSTLDLTKQMDLLCNKIREWNKLN